MKSRKTKIAILACSLASVGIISAAATTVAVYLISAQDKVITISTKSTDGSFAIAGLTDNQTLDLKTGKLAYKYQISSVLPANTTYHQQFITGKLNVKITSDSTELIENLTASNVVEYDAVTYPFVNANAVHTTVEFNKTTNTIEGSVNATIETNGSKNVDLVLSLPTTLDDATYLAIAGDALKVDITWGETDNYEYASVRGESPFAWGGNDYGRMVQNIKADKFEWMWTAHETIENATYKFAKGDKWLAGSNITKTINAGDSLYWDGKTGE